MHGDDLDLVIWHDRNSPPLFPVGLICTILREDAKQQAKEEQNPSGEEPMKSIVALGPTSPKSGKHFGFVPFFPICALAMFVFLSATIAQADLAPTSAEENGAQSQRVVSLDKIFNPSIPLSDNYPTHSSGLYARGDEEVFWMDNQRIIFWTLEESQTAEDVIGRNIARFVGPQKADQLNLSPRHINVTQIWDVDRDDITQYRVGRVTCYQDGLINIGVPEDMKNAWKHWDLVALAGPLGQEKPVDKAAKPRWYMHSSDCGDEPSAITKKYMEDHPEKYVRPLRKEDGFIVLGTHEYGTRGSALPQDFVTYHPVGKPTITLKMSNDWPARIKYFHFARAYLLLDRRPIDVDLGRTPRFKSLFKVLQPNGGFREIKIPEALSDKGVSVPYLSRRGILWACNAINNSEPGIYISRGGEIKKISSDSVQEGQISPDGCRFAYLKHEKGQLGSRLKVIDLCEGVQ